MSVYQRFIDSAASEQHQKRSTVHRDRFHEHTDHCQLEHIPLDTTMIKQQAQPTTNGPLFAAGLAPTISSTPLNKHQYKRLVEAERLYAARNQHSYQPEVDARKQQHYQMHSHNTLRQHNQHQHNHHHHHNHKHHCQNHHHNKCQPIDAFFKTDDPILLKWLQAMRFETELECLSSLQARTLAIDEYSAGALSIRNSQVSIQEMRSESNFILDYIDYLIECLPLKFNTVGKYSIEFSELWTRVMNQTTAQTNKSTATSTTSHQIPHATLTSNNQNNLTIINCTPRKSFAPVKSLRPLDELVVQIRTLCIDYANILYEYQEDDTQHINNGHLECELRRLKELYGRFIEISIKAECANIVQALNYDFSQSSLNRLSSSSSLVHPVRPFESSSSQLPLKWALIALWQLTKDDSYICRTLTEKWQATSAADPDQSAVSRRVAKRLDYSTKYEQPAGGISSGSSSTDSYATSHALRCESQKLYQICQDNNNRRLNSNHPSRSNQENDENRAAGALSSALKSKQQQPQKQVSTIELLIDIIISQPNKHERLDMMNFIHSQAMQDKLIDLDEWDQSVSAAIYTSNQFKVAALRILNHLCVNEQAVKTILKCFSTPPPVRGQPIPENKIIRSIFECYQTSQEHIYQNEVMFHPVVSAQINGRKKFCKPQQQQQQVAAGAFDQDDEYSDYGSRQTNSYQTNSATRSQGGYANSQTSTSVAEETDDGDDVVVKEAIRLLVQLTTPFHRSNKGLDYYTLIGQFSIDSLVKYLTNIIKSTSSREMLFLSLTALANISFITTEPMRLYGTNRVMLEMFRASKSRSKDLELRDQAVTILANTADKNLLDIVSSAGLTFLLSCLESCPTRMANYKQLDRSRQRDPLAGHGGSDDDIQRLNIENKPRDRKPIDFSEEFPDVLECACDQQQSQNNTLRYGNTSANTSPTRLGYRQATSLCLSRLSSSDLAAMERIHQKTAVAFARMSVDPSTTRMVLKYGGIKQMIDLCKFSHKRNHSDTVLIACIAALRKMAKVIESETFRYYNALDLIELELNQALEIYGAPRDSPLSDGHHQRLFASDV